MSLKLKYFLIIYTSITFGYSYLKLKIMATKKDLLKSLGVVLLSTIIIIGIAYFRGDF